MGNSASKQSTKFVAKSRKLGAKVVSDQNHRILANQTEFIPNSAKQPLSVNDNDNNTTSRNGPIESSQSSQINSFNNDNSSPPGKDGYDVQYLQRVQQLGNVISDSFISDKPAKGSSSEPKSQKNQQLLDMIIKHLDSLPSQNQKTMKNKPVVANNNNEMLNALKNRKVQTEAATADSSEEEGKSNTNTQENEQQEKRINNKNSTRRYIHPQTLTAIITSRETDSIEKILTDYNLDPLVFKNFLEKSTRLQLIPKEQQSPTKQQAAVHYSEAARQQSFLKESDLDSLANDSEHEMIKNTIIKSGKGDIIGRFNQSSTSSSPSPTSSSPSSIKQQEEDAKNPENYSIATRRLLKRLEQMKYYNKAPVEASPNHKNQDQQQLLDYNKINQYIQQSGNNDNNKKKKQSSSKPTTKVPKQLSLDD